MSDNRSTTGPAKKSRIKIHETTHENDIRYRGPFSSQHFKMFGWLCLVAAQVAVLIKTGGRFDARFAADTASLQQALGFIADLALPFLLIANFAQILNAEDGYKKQLIVNGAASAGICALYYLVFYRYIVGNVAAVLEQPSEALPTVQEVMGHITPYGFLAFNLFVDLFLCTLTMVFLNYNPRRVFTGKLRILFRLLALLPIAYEVGCMLLKISAAKGLVQVPAWAFPLLTVKPPMTFVLFVALALFVKTRELRFRRHGKTHEEYRAFLKTRRNALNFSVFMAIMLVIVGIADLALALGFSLNETVQTITANYEVSESTNAPGNAPAAGAAATPRPAQTAAGKSQSPAPSPEATAAHEAPDSLPSEEQILASIDSGIRLAEAVGFGDSISLIFLAPLALLFCYTRKPKYPRLDMLIPVAGIALILFAYLEGVHQLLLTLPIQKISLREFQNTTDMYKILLQ